MSTPSCQISTPNRIVVFEYEVLKVFVCKSDTFFLVHPVVLSKPHYYQFSRIILFQGQNEHFNSMT